MLRLTDQFTFVAQLVTLRSNIYARLLLYKVNSCLQRILWDYRQTNK